MSTATRILVIDDDNSYRSILIRRVKSFFPDCSFHEFDNLTKAREFLAENRNLVWDLVILDEHLPDGRGVELLKEGWFEGLAVITISSDQDPTTPGRVVGAGASFFMDKLQIREPLFEHLLRGIIERNSLQRELTQIRMQEQQLDTVKTLVSTLRHEINNPLGAVLGAAYLLKNSAGSSPEQKEAARLVEDSGNRIKHVLDQLCKAIALDSVAKANQKVFHIPGDAPWESSASDKSKK